MRQNEGSRALVPLARSVEKKVTAAACHLIGMCFSGLRDGCSALYYLLEAANLVPDSDPLWLAILGCIADASLTIPNHSFFQVAHILKMKLARGKWWKMEADSAVQLAEEMNARNPSLAQLCALRAVALYNANQKSAGYLAFRCLGLAHEALGELVEAEAQFQQAAQVAAKGKQTDEAQADLANVRSRHEPSKWTQAMEGRFRRHLETFAKAEASTLNSTSADLQQLDGIILPDLKRALLLLGGNNADAWSVPVVRMIQNFASPSFLLRTSQPSEPLTSATSVPPSNFACYSLACCQDGGLIHVWFARGDNFGAGIQPPPDYHYHRFKPSPGFIDLLQRLQSLHSQLDEDLSCLYEELINPIPNFPSAGEALPPTMLVSAFGTLGSIPFAALHPLKDREAILAKRISVCSVPCSAVFNALRQRATHQASHRPKYAVGPLLDPGKATDSQLGGIFYNLIAKKSLPSSIKESQKISQGALHLRRFVSSAPLFDMTTSSATPPLSVVQVRAKMEAYAESPTGIVTHFAAHASPKTTLSSPDAAIFTVAGVGGQWRTALQHNHITLCDDPQDANILKPDDVLNFNLNGLPLVFLNSCGSNLGYSAEDFLESNFGFPRCLLCAGVSAVVSTLRVVDDVPAAKFGAAFYRHWRSTPSIHAAEALRLTQLEMRQKNREPRFWAWHSIVGFPFV